MFLKLYCIISDMKKEKNRNYTVPRAISHIRFISDFIHFGKVGSAVTWSYPRHTHDSYEFIYIKKGIVHYRIDNSEFKSGDGTLYFIRPGQNHEEISALPPFLFYYVKFNLYNLAGKTVDLLPAEEPVQRQILANCRTFLALFENMYNEVKNNKNGAHEIISYNIAELAVRVERELGTLPQFREHRRLHNEQIVRKIQHYLSLHLDRVISLDELSRHCNLSADYLGHIFKKEAGISPHAYAMSLRIEQAKQLIGEGSMTLAEISGRLAFSDTSHFSRVFKAAVKISPRLFGRR